MLRIAVEIFVMWLCYALYMIIIVYKRGPIGGIFFYPKVMQERTIELGLITRRELMRRKTFAYALIIAWMLIIPGIMIICINGTRSFFDCSLQFYVLFLGAEFYDWLFIDTIWVALSDWWLIPGTEDLNDTWHNVNVKKWKFVKLIPFSIPIAAFAGGIYWFIGLSL
ncbi:hypothetical protein [Butyrivibrio sp.]|uniref:hypothetical protein n=1 Tax=Butyrivibrio sp. TaxID=28121 RepID=UPI0025BD97CC|nr:hypothetical protein [Butyrivibrio sp.]